MADRKNTRAAPSACRSAEGLIALERPGSEKNDGTTGAAALIALAGRQWGFQPARARLLRNGHTNKCFLLDGDGARPLVLRISWPGKPAEQVAQEAAVLAHLASVPGLPALPRPLPTLAGQSSVVAPGGHWLHLFAPLPGEPGPSGGIDAARGGNAMRGLAHLHAALAGMPTSAEAPHSPPGPVAWLRRRFDRVADRSSPILPTVLAVDYGRLLQAVGKHLADAEDRLAGEPVHWLHGDYHAGNLLFAGTALSGIVDFDETGLGAQQLEAVFALFALTRDAAAEDRFSFDASAWRAGLEAYAQARASVSMAQLASRRDALVPLFCADQVLIHLEAAQRGLWKLGPGIGFLPCWRRLV